LKEVQLGLPACHFLLIGKLECKLSNNVLPSARTEIYFSFIEDPTTETMAQLGPLCGLRSGDWRLATRWHSLPEASHVSTTGVCKSYGIHRELIIGMFTELMTAWKKKTYDEEGAPIASTAQGHDLLDDWKLRRVGVLFSKQKGGANNHDMWVFLIFFQPADQILGIREPQTDLEFPHIVVDMNTDTPNVFHQGNNFGYYYDRDDDIKDLIVYLVAKLEVQGARFLSELADEIFWGWGTLLKDVRTKILNVTRRVIDRS